MKHLNTFASIALAVAGLGAVGCESHNVPVQSAKMADISVTQSAKKVNVNETVTFEVSDSNTLGRKADVTWEKTGGNLWYADDTKRVVQVSFNQPGTYSVTAILTVDGRESKRMRYDVDVQPLPIQK